MEKLFCPIFRKKEMGSVHTVVGVKQVKQEASQEWNENMPLPGDIIEGFALQDKYDHDCLLIPINAKSELSSQLGKISRQVEAIWVKIKRGDSTLYLRACVVPDKCSKLSRKFTIRAASDDRHIAVLGDLTLDQCTVLQEMSKRVVNMDYRGFNQKGVKYDWKMKVGTFLPYPRSTVVSSILFMPLAGENNIEATTARSMAWFSAAVASGAPLIFVNIQTEQTVISEKTKSTGKASGRSRQNNSGSTPQIVQGVRLWYLPGVAEVPVELIPELGETRFGMNIKRTDEGLICVFSVTGGCAADRAGLGQLCEEANRTGSLVVMTRLEGRSLLPSTVCSAGLISCCDYGEIKETLNSMIDEMESVHIQVMAWPNQTFPHACQPVGAAKLQPPSEYHSMPPL